MKVLPSKEDEDAKTLKDESSKKVHNMLDSS